MPTVPTELRLACYSLQLDLAQVDVILRGLFSLVKELPVQLDSTLPESAQEKHLLDVNRQATLLIDILVELPGVIRQGRSQ
jgi:hypothetical protein